MKVTISSGTSSIDDVMRDEIRNRIYSALSRFSHSIDEITVRIGETVRIGDVVGTRGRSQQLCRLSVRMKRLGSFLVESVEEETLDAVSRAVECAEKQVLRILDRRHDVT